MSNQNAFKKKFNLILIGSLALLGVLGTVIVGTIVSIKNNVEATQKVSETSTNMALCQSANRGFLLNAWTDTVFVRTGTNPDFEKFKEESDKLDVNIQYLEENSNDENQKVLSETEKSGKELKGAFTRIAELIKERGFKNLGLEGKLREAVHILENSDGINDRSLVLSLRKHEKDFFLRKDPVYLEKFEQDAAMLELKLNALPDSPEKIKLLEANQTYLNTFKSIVGIETEIGLTKAHGLRGKINNIIALNIQNLDSLNEDFQKTTKNLIFTIIGFISLVFLIILGVVYVGLNKLIKPVFEPMQDIQVKVGEISEGNLSVNFEEHKDNTVLKDLIDGFEKIITKFKTTMDQVEGISSRQVLTELPIHSANDEVGITLNKIITQIKKIDDEEKRRTWHNEGVAKFANVIRMNTNEEDLYNGVITELIKYLDANQGALFIIEGEEENDVHLAMKGCYAYNRKKYVGMRINLGEGLAGTCWAEGGSIVMTQVPESYVRINSGLGDATPRCILITPIKFNDKVQGIIEIASFHRLEEHNIKFTEAIAESLGSAVHNMKSSTKTVTLLQSSQQMTEELKAQEEEMRQNMEELQATQEEMARMSSDLKNELEELKSENAELKASIKNMD